MDCSTSLRAAGCSGRRRRKTRRKKRRTRRPFFVGGRGWFSTGVLGKETRDYDQRMNWQHQHPGVVEKGNTAREIPTQIEAVSNEDPEREVSISGSESDGEARRVPRTDLRRARTPEVSSSEWSSDSDDEEERILKEELEADKVYMSQAFVARKEAGARETRRLLGRMWALEDFQTGRGILQWVAAKELQAAHEVAEEAWRTYQIRKERMRNDRVHPRDQIREYDGADWRTRTPTTERMYSEWRTRWERTRQQVESAVEWTTAALHRKQAACTLLALGWPCAIQDEATPVAPRPEGPRPRKQSERKGTRHSGSRGSRC